MQRLQFMNSLYRIALLSICLYVVGCTTTQTNLAVIEHHPYNYVDSAFYPILTSFEYEARSRGVLIDKSNLSITFGLIRHNKSTTLGYCSRDQLGGMIIKIHYPSWVLLDDYRKEELLFHELGHCILGRPHCSRINKDGLLSIMFPSLMTTKYYKENREELIDELFSVSPECLRDNGNSNAVHGSICAPPHRATKR